MAESRNLRELLEQLDSAETRIRAEREAKKQVQVKIANLLSDGEATHYVSGSGRPEYVCMQNRTVYQPFKKPLLREILQQWSDEKQQSIDVDEIVEFLWISRAKKEVEVLSRSATFLPVKRKIALDIGMDNFQL